MNLEKLVKQGLARVNCSHHVWKISYLPSGGYTLYTCGYALYTCAKCETTGISFLEDYSKITLIENHIKIKHTHVFKNNICTNCNVLSKYIQQYNTEVPLEPITCSDKLLKDIIE